MSTYLPALQVALPIISAPICFLMQRTRIVWGFTLAVSALATVISIALLLEIYKSGNIILNFGSILTNTGIEFHIDYLSAYSLLAICAITTLSLFAAHTVLKRQVEDDKHIMLYSNLLVCLAGVSGVIASGDLISAFLFLEISSFGAYKMAMLGNEKPSALAGFRYFILGSLGAMAILASIILFYSTIGTVNLSLMQSNGLEFSDPARISIASILLVSGISLKLGLFPFHLWLPGVYRHTCSMATVFLATMVIQVGVYLLLRTSSLSLIAGTSTGRVIVLDILIVMSLGAVLLGSIAAIYQKDLKLLLAYSTLAQIGFLVLGLAIGTANGLMASSVQLFNHSLINGLLFIGIIALIYRMGHSDINRLSGMGRQMPWTFAALFVAGLSLAGMPLTAGFVSKWYLVLALVESSSWLVLLLTLLGGVFTCVYIWRIIEPAYLKPSPVDAPVSHEAPRSLLFPIWILAIGNIYLGIDTRLTVGTSQIISQGIFGSNQ